MNSLQSRSFLNSFETREENGDMYISGYFAVFNSNYEVYPGLTESIDSKAFDNTLDGDIRCLIDHETSLVLGRTKSKTLNLKVDGKGLWGEVRINPKDQDAINLYYRVMRGDVDQCSFGFEILDEERSIDENTGNVHYLIKSVRLHEVSVVTFPAYESTSVSARKKQEETLIKRSNQEFKNKLLLRLKGENQAC